MADKKPGLLGRLFGSSSQPVPPAPAPAHDPRISWPKTTTVFSLGIPSKIGDHKAKYRYDDVAAAFSSNIYFPGLPLNLRATGEIYANGNLIGTFSGEKIRKMVRDFYDRGDPVQAKLFRMNEDATGLIYVVFSLPRVFLPDSWPAPARRSRSWRIAHIAPARSAPPPACQGIGCPPHD